MAEQGQNFEIFAGDDHFPIIEVTDDAGVAKDMSTATEVTFNFMRNPTDAPLFSKTKVAGGEITVSGDDNEFASVELLPADTNDPADLSGEFYWELILKDAAGRTSHTTTGLATILHSFAVIVRLEVNMDYLKRLKEVVPSAHKGMTRHELDKASKSAEDDVIIILNQIGFVTTVFTDKTNTPHNIQEIILMLASARVWNRMLLEYDDDTPFSETFGAALLKMAQSSLDDIEKRRLLRDPATGLMIKPTVAEAGRGAPTFRSAALGVRPNAQIVPDSEINDFIHNHGRTHSTRHQPDPFTRL